MSERDLQCRCTIGPTRECPVHGQNRPSPPTAGSGSGGVTVPGYLSNPVGTLALLFARLEADGGRYLISVGLTREERTAMPDPTYGGKGHQRWLTEEERAALLALPHEIERLRAALAEVRRLIMLECGSDDWWVEQHHHLSHAIRVIDGARPAVERDPKQPCAPDDHLYAARAGSSIGDGVCIKCGAQEVK